MDEVLKEKKENLRREKKVDTFNSLVKINNDRIEGYNKASEHTEEADLKSLFTQFIDTSERCKVQLIKNIKSLGGEPDSGSIASGKFFRTWMEVKAALTGDERKAIFDSCQSGDEKAIETYQDVLKDYEEYLDDEEISMIQSQLGSLQSDYKKIKELSDSLTD